MNITIPKRSGSRVENYKQRPESKTTSNKMKMRSNELSKIKLNDHVLKNMTNHWNKAIEKIKQSKRHWSRERPRASVDFNAPIINISTNTYTKPKILRCKTGTKLRPDFTRQYKAKKELEVIDQSVFKLMCNKDKINHIKNLVNITKDDESLTSNDSLCHPPNQYTTSKCSYFNP
jgi:hypothetical protein